MRTLAVSYRTGFKPVNAGFNTRFGHSPRPINPKYTDKLTAVCQYVYGKHQGTRGEELLLITGHSVYVSALAPLNAMMLWSRLGSGHKYPIYYITGNKADGFSITYVNRDADLKQCRLAPTAKDIQDLEGLLDKLEVPKIQNNT